MCSSSDWFEEWIENNGVVDKDQSNSSYFHQPFNDLELKPPPKKKQKKRHKLKNSDDSHLFKEWLESNDLLDKDQEKQEELENTPFKKKDLKGSIEAEKTEKFVKNDKALFEQWLNRNDVIDKDETLSSQTIRMYPPDYVDAVRIDATIDLHKLTVAQAIRMVEQFIYHCYQRNDQVLRVIHGKGNHSQGPPRVKLAVLQWFRTNGKGNIKYFREASKKHGGAGATIVWLK